LTGLLLDANGLRIVKRGGDKSLDKIDPVEADDTLLIMEIMARAPNMAPEAYQHAFMTLREEYGEYALQAIREGAVQFELVKPRDRKDLPDIGEFPGKVEGGE
jgi:hypothetical protein